MKNSILTIFSKSVLSLCLLGAVSFSACQPGESTATVTSPQDEGEAVYPTSQILASPKTTTIEGGHYKFVKIDFTSFNLYLSDDFLAINENEVVANLPIVDKQFSYSLSIDRIKAARLRAVKADGTVTDYFMDFFLVPGDTVDVEIREPLLGQSKNYHVVRYSQRNKISIEHFAWVLRNSLKWTSPNYPKVEGKCWDYPQNDTYDNATERYQVRQVYFNPDETVVRLISLDFFSEPVVSSNCYLVDEKGNMYTFKRVVYGNIDNDFGPEASVFGAYYAFEPLPEGTERFNFYMGDKSMTAVMNIHERTPEKKMASNFHLEVNVAPGVWDKGYMIYFGDLFETRYKGQELEVKDGKCHYDLYVDKPKWMTLKGYKEDGPIEHSNISVPVIPGERAEVRVMNGSYYYSGSTFYQQYCQADYLDENVRRYNNKPMADSLYMDYLRKHANEEGCILFYQIHYLVPQDSLRKYMPESIKEGRLKPILSLYK